MVRSVGAIIELTDGEWALVEDLFDPPGRCGAPAVYPHRLTVDAMLFLDRTGCQWRCLPERYPLIVPGDCAAELHDPSAVPEQNYAAAIDCER